MSISRVVALLTPVFGAVAAVGSGWLAKHFPGLPTPNTSELVGIETLGFTSATAAALKWLHGHAQYEARVENAETVAKEVMHGAQVADPTLVDAISTFVKAEVDKLEGKLTSEDPAPDVSGLEVSSITPTLGGQEALKVQYAVPPTTTSPVPS